MLLKGYELKAKVLLEESLPYTLKQPVGDWQGRHHNWMSKIYLSLNRKDKALKSFEVWVDEGHYSAVVTSGSIYSELRSEPRFTLALEHLFEKLNAARDDIKNERKMPLSSTPE